MWTTKPIPSFDSLRTPPGNPPSSTAIATTTAPLPPSPLLPPPSNPSPSLNPSGLKKQKSRRLTNLIRSAFLDSFHTIQKNKPTDPLLDVLSLSDTGSDASLPWYNRRGVKRKMVSLFIILFLIFTTMFLLRKETTMESSMKQTRKTTKRQLVAVGVIEVRHANPNRHAAKMRCCRATSAPSQYLSYPSHPRWLS